MVNENESSDIGTIRPKTFAARPASRGADGGFLRGLRIDALLYLPRCAESVGAPFRQSLTSKLLAVARRVRASH
jgi:hypothetical protein